MPTVLREAGFVVRIFLPPREHEPPHVHVLRAGGEAVVELGRCGKPCRLREAHGMSDADVVKAFRIIETNLGLLLEEWTRYHAK